MNEGELGFSATKYKLEQKELHDYIKSLRVNGMSYHRITKLLNEKGIITHKVSVLGVTMSLQSSKITKKD